MLRNNPREDRLDRLGGDDASRDSLSTPTTRPLRDQLNPEAERTGTIASGVRTERSSSVIDAASSFDGRYEAGDDLVVLGNAIGELICRGRLTIEKEATVKAKIQAHEAHILGRVEGDIVCSGRLLLAASATVSGTVKAAALVVEEGATIRGNVETASVASSDVLPSVTRNPRRSQAEGEAGNQAGGRWNRGREVPNFAVVPGEESTEE
ncbi:MAG: polymer-forming cytoskeletal protein [Dehalococcoidia bacterium]